jgi:hypothetical protein
MSYRIPPKTPCARRRFQRVLVTTGLAACVLGGTASHGTAASLMSCRVIKWSESNYWYQEGAWAGLDPRSGQTMPRDTYFREWLPPASYHGTIPIGYLFSQLDKTQVVVKQLYADGWPGGELTGRVLHRIDDSVLIQWPLPPAVSMRSALINTKAKHAVISMLETGSSALSVYSAIADCQ